MSNSAIAPRRPRPASRPRRATVRRMGPPKNILLVEDDAKIRQMIATVLGAAGHTTLQAGGAKEALDVLAAKPVALLITDLMMPGLSGGDLCAKLAVHPTWSK